MLPTVRLFDIEPEELEFTASVLACEADGDGFLVTLDRTAFFPEGGGQGADHGVLGGARVTDVHERGGVVVHRTDAPLEPGQTVRGQVDAVRRLDMCQQHTGEHILTGIAHGLYGVENVGFHIGSDAVTVDFDIQLTPEQVANVERLANEVVWRDQPVRAWYPDAEELAGLEYRSKKAIDGPVRIVRIDGVDTCACCGTHVRSTGRVGQIKILSCIHYKGGVRLSILCGRRALEAVNAVLEEDRAVSRVLSAAPGTLAEAAARLVAERDALRALQERTAAQLFARDAEREAGRSVRVVACAELPQAHLRRAAGDLARGARLGLALIPRGEGWSFALSGEGDCRAAAAALTARFGGKGGGARDMVQGVLDGGEPEDFRAVLSEV